MILLKFRATMIVIVCSWFSMLSCTENSNGSSATNSTSNVNSLNYTFDGSEGEPMDERIATQWIDNFVRQNKGANTAFFFGRESLQDILNQDQCVGIRFYYGIDEQGNMNLLAIGADKNGNNCTPFLGTSGVNSSINILGKSMVRFAGNEGARIAASTASLWLSIYKLVKPNNIRGHFFGQEVISQLLLEEGCIGVRGYFALNETGVQKLLLVGVSTSGANLLPSTSKGRVNGSEMTVNDFSYACPPYCQGNG